MVTLGPAQGAVKKWIKFVTHNRRHRRSSPRLGAAALVAEPGPPRAEPRNRVDQRTERTLGALACTVLVLIAGMIVFVFAKAWPSFAHNGLAWFGPAATSTSSSPTSSLARRPSHYIYTFHACR